MSTLESAFAARQVQDLLHQARQFTRTGRALEAERCLRRAITACAGFKPRIHFGRFLYRRGRFEDAETVLNEAWQSRRCAGDDSERALCCRELAILHRLAGRFDPAEQFRQLALESELRLHGRPSGVSLWLAACEAVDAQRCDDAESLLNASASCIPAPRASDLLAERGRLQRLRGDLPGAISLLRRAARRLNRRNNPFTAGRILEELGRTCCDDQRFRTAAKALIRAASVFQSIGRTEEAWRAISAAREANRRHRLLQSAAARN